MTTYTATYSPDDNKLRLYATSRLDKELYERVKAVGFRWAPKQDLFFTTWNPRAEDLAIELAGEIEDDDKSLTDRAEERADRFEGYQERRADEAERARAAVSAIADNIPFGQPILIGHHSERRARKDAEKIENGMRKAVQLWETSEYWQTRAKGAIAHAKYKELPKVRARRIKTIEADLRREQRTQAEAGKWLKAWTDEGLTLEKARIIAGYCHLGVERNDHGSYWSAYDVLRPDGERYQACPAYTLEQVQEKARKAYPRSIAAAQRWIDHYQNRLTYEKAMLAEQGASALIAPKARPKQLPLVNYEAETIPAKALYSREMEKLPQIKMTSAQYQAIYSEQRGTREIDNSHRIRVARVALNDDGTPKRFAGFGGCLYAVFLTDSKTHERPAPIEKQVIIPPPREPVTREPVEADPRAAEFAQLKEQAKHGVEVVTAPELFVTPPELAQRVAETADIKPGHTVLEPSAGTGALLEAARERGGITTAVEINYKLASLLSQRFDDVRTADFLQCGAELGKFDRVIMNPPFADQADIAHVTHAMTFLKEGGKLVAIMSAGVSFRTDRKAARFRATVEKMGGTIEALPPDSFKLSGTSVNTVLVQVSNPPARAEITPTVYRTQTSIDL
jgi:predicted RNA methylase